MADPASLISIDPAILGMSITKPDSLTQQLNKLIVDNPAIIGILSDLLNEQHPIDATTTKNALNEQLQNLVLSMQANMFPFAIYKTTLMLSTVFMLNK